MKNACRHFCNWRQKHNSISVHGMKPWLSRIGTTFRDPWLLLVLQGPGAMIDVRWSGASQPRGKMGCRAGQGGGGGEGVVKG